MKTRPSIWTWSSLGLSLLLCVQVLAGPFDDFSDLRGPFCEYKGCCDGRKDECSSPILGTLCYCDDFCNQTRVDDCCPDYWTYCKGLPFPTTPRVPTTTRAPPENIYACTYNGRVFPHNASIKQNCNEW